MPRQDIDYTLYLATDRRFLRGRPLEEVVAEAVAGGVTMVQLREKELTAGETYALGRRLLQATRAARIPLIVNDRLDLMLALGADGVHLGRSDLPLAEARRILGPGKILGYSANRPEHLEQALAAGADYAGIGPVFSTGTKTDTAPAIGLDGVRQLTSLGGTFPCIGIGGIGADTCGAVVAAGAAGVCVISAILGAPEPGMAARQFRQAIGQARTPTRG